MKYLLIIPMAMVLSLGAQNFAVRFYGPGNLAGLPEFWPVQVQPLGTNTTVVPPFVLMTAAQLADCIATNQTAYTEWESNKVYIAKAALDANTARLLTIYDAIPAARTTLRSFATATNTLTTAQLTTATRQMADYQEKIMEFLQRLGPVLKSMYRPEEDTTQ